MAPATSKQSASDEHGKRSGRTLSDEAREVEARTLVREVTCPKSRSSGCRAGHARLPSRSSVSARARLVLNQQRGPPPARRCRLYRRMELRRRAATTIAAPSAHTSGPRTPTPTPPPDGPDRRRSGSGSADPFPTGPARATPPTPKGSARRGSPRSGPQRSHPPIRTIRPAPVAERPQRLGRPADPGRVRTSLPRPDKGSSRLHNSDPGPHAAYPILLGVRAGAAMSDARHRSRLGPMPGCP